MQEFAPEVVFHLAAQPLVRRSYADPVGTYATNVMGTAHVLEAVRKTPSVRAVVCVTTDKCYENREWDMAVSRDGCSWTAMIPIPRAKPARRFVSAAYRRSFFSEEASGEPRVLLATARAGNVIGGRRLVGRPADSRPDPRISRSGEPVLIRRPSAVRPWQHVLEPVHGYILLAERLLSQENCVRLRVQLWARR